MKQNWFASAAWEKNGKVARRKRFLAEIGVVMPWLGQLEVTHPHRAKSGGGTQPTPLRRLTRFTPATASGGCKTLSLTGGA